ncbi:uncharacterized protein GGS22DRAFT_176001 [Annulohypoxylon maeteangense]|uniref:uncharacterized protein n=1 Tax=Annulohypoxylon maeteangense TaxID=1927788 RepID=UPI0020076C76|nr:uncharacterized protein GGS22DRAFT_176001 [Annulohypoxylon maeteangense]KAI0880044.1 hypothetical protein GGS22DRAFT_176001 [Annulohypoxylon maeteangense]
MKLQGFLLPALAGITTAKSEEQLQNAEVYIIKQQETKFSNVPSIPQDLAQAILLQRLSTSEQPSILGQLPESISQDESILYLNQYAKTPRPLFEEVDANEPRQLVIAFSGVTTQKQKDLQAALPGVPLAFTAPGLSRLSAKGKKTGCAFDQSINPENAKCWKGKTQYLEYNAAKDKNIIKQLSQNIATLQSRAQSSTLETTILLLADPSSSPLRRDILEDELVMAEDIPTADSSFNADGTKKPSDPSKPFHAFSSKPTNLASRPGILPSCFTSHNACITATDSCSGHGQCLDKWSTIDSGDKACFSCRCMSTNETNAEGHTSLYHWGGSACHKRDISTPFWLFAGTTLALVGTVVFAIGLLFNVGEEKLPGVIGAGVSRSGK